MILTGDECTGAKNSGLVLWLFLVAMFVVVFLSKYLDSKDIGISFIGLQNIMTEYNILNVVLLLTHNKASITGSLIFWFKFTDLSDIHEHHIFHTHFD